VGNSVGIRGDEVGVIIAWNPPEFLAILLWIGVGGIVSGLAGPVLIGSLWRRATKAAAISFSSSELAVTPSYIWDSCPKIRSVPLDTPSSSPR